MGTQHSKAGNAEASNMKSDLSLSYFEYYDLSYYHIEKINVKSKIKPTTPKEKENRRRKNKRRRKAHFGPSKE